MLDYNRSNTVEDILRRYDLEGLKRDRNRVYQIQGELTNTEGILNDFVDATTQDIDIINDQLDGNVTSWFYGYIPTLSNVPASNWATDDDKKEHLADLFYNTDTGKVYKFTTGLTSANLYDSDNAPELSTSTMHGKQILVQDLRIQTVSMNPNFKVTYIECSPNTKYKVKKSIGSYFKLATSTDLTVVSYYIPCNKAYDLDNETEYEITTGANDHYLLIGYKVVSGETKDDIRASIEIISEYETEQYVWEEVTNIIGAQTLAVANAAQDTQDHNRRVFVVQPTPPYDVGDVWNNNDNHKLYRCRVSKSAQQSFSSDDWIDSLKYVDNSYAIAVENEMITSYATKSELTTTENSINASVKALKVTTDAKHSIYQSQPTPPYYVGDIYISSGNVYNCIQDRTTGSFTQSDWELDTTLTEYVSQAGISIFQDSINMIVENTIGTDGSKIASTINQTAQSVNISANKIGLSGETINLTSKNLSISSNNFSVDNNGNMTCANANITDGTIDISGPGGYGNISLTDTTSGARVLINTDTISVADAQISTNSSIISPGTINTQKYFYTDNISSGNVNFYSEFAKNYGYFYSYNANELIKFEIFDDSNNPYIQVFKNGAGTSISNNGIWADGYYPNSKEELKKDFEKLPSGLDILKDVEIYKYRYKTEDDTKKHIGFVIGDNYKYSEEITDNDNGAADLYSFVSVCCKAIQEQQKEIEELKKRLEELENGKIR